MPEALSLRERQVEIKKGLHVEFKYPPQHDYSSNTVAVLVDFKKFMQLTSIDLGKMPTGLSKWWKQIAPRDAYEAKDMERYRKINRGIYKDGEMEMPEIVYPDYEGKVSIIEGRHRLRAFEAAGAEKILVLVDKNHAAELQAAVGVNSDPSCVNQAKPVADQSLQETDTQWAQHVRQQRESFEAQKDAVRKAGASSRGILGKY
jgi:hypothetical protein